VPVPGPYHPSQQGRPASELVTEIEQVVRRSLNPAHPGYLGHMDTLASAIGIFSDAVVSALNNNMLSWEMSPVFTEMESRVLYAFNDVPFDRQNARFWGFTLDWWKNVFSFPGLGDAFENSLKIAPISAVVATALGTLFGLHWSLPLPGLIPVSASSWLRGARDVLGPSLLSMFV
jgi:hypothetical protein